MSIKTRMRRQEKTLADVKSFAERLLGKPNGDAIGGYEPGSLIAKTVSADGTPGRWRVVIQWEPK